MVCVFTCNNERVEISNNQALVLELALNSSMYGRLWNELGDTLYEIHTGRNKKNYFVVEADRIKWIQTIITM